jgi:hypothetical protein
LKGDGSMEAIGGDGDVMYVLCVSGRFTIVNVQRRAKYTERLLHATLNVLYTTAIRVVATLIAERHVSQYS